MSRTSTCVLLCSLVVLSLLSVVPLWAARPAIPQGVVVPQKPKVYIVRQDFEPLHSCGSPECPVVGQVERGERLAILETVGHWYRVRGLTSGKEGWLDSKRPQMLPQQARVIARTLNLRSCASTGCAVLARLPKGQVLLVLERGNGWTRVRLDAAGLEGWVAERYIRYF